MCCVRNGINVPRVLGSEQAAVLLSASPMEHCQEEEAVRWDNAVVSRCLMKGDSEVEELAFGRYM